MSANTLQMLAVKDDATAPAADGLGRRIALAAAVGCGALLVGVAMAAVVLALSGAGGAGEAAALPHGRGEATPDVRGALRPGIGGSAPLASATPRTVGPFGDERAAAVFSGTASSAAAATVGTETSSSAGRDASRREAAGTAAGGAAARAARHDERTRSSGRAAAAAATSSAQSAAAASAPTFARRVLLEVVDDVGEPVAVDAAWADDGSLLAAAAAGAEALAEAAAALRRSAAAATGSVTGIVELPAVPEGRLILWASVGGRTYAQPLDAASTTARLVVPAHGRLIARLGLLGRTDRDDLRLRVVPLDGGPQATPFDAATAPDPWTGDLVVEPLPTGRYRLELRSVPVDGAAATPLAAPVEVVVPARGTAVAAVGA